MVSFQCAVTHGPEDFLFVKTIITKWTAERFLSSVPSNYVSLKLRFLCKRFVTQWTAVRFLSSVQSHVILKIVFSWKQFITNWTAVRFLSSVHSHMFLKVTQTWQLFDTIWTTVSCISCILTSPENNGLSWNDSRSYCVHSGFFPHVTHHVASKGLFHSFEAEFQICFQLMQI